MDLINGGIRVRVDWSGDDYFAHPLSDVTDHLAGGACLRLLPDGQMTILLDNRTRRFDPFVDSTGMKVQFDLRAKLTNKWQPIWVGWLESWDEAHRSPLVNVLTGYCFAAVDGSQAQHDRRAAKLLR